MNAKITKDFKKIFVLCSVFQLMIMSATGQQCYDNFEGSRFLHYGERFGVLDTSAKNQIPNDINNSAKCGMYVRNGARRYANIKMNLTGKLSGVEAYATYLGVPPQLKLKVYTAAPVGTLVEILLGAKRGNNDFPAGTHSQYQAYTTKSNEWEELQFKFSQIPQGSETSASQIDQIVIMFNPGTSTSDSYYFDDLTGPAIEGSGKKESTKQEKATKAKSRESGAKTKQGKQNAGEKEKSEVN